jgi:hypothetical protein
VTADDTEGPKMFPLWVYAAVALTIAIVAFALAQWVPGLGAIFVAGASTSWVAYSAYRGARARQR